VSGEEEEKVPRQITRPTKNWRLIGGGIGIHWPDLEGDISVSALLK